MCKRNACLLTGLVVATLLLAAACQAQPERGLRGRLPGSGAAALMMEEIYILQRLVPLELTDEQLDAILQAYQGQPAEPDDENLAQLREMRQRLIGGTPLVASDLQILRQLVQQVATARRSGERPEREQLPPLGQTIWNLLTTQQKAILLGETSGPAADNQRAARQVALRAIRTIGQWRGLDPAAWQGARDFLAQALAAPAGSRDSDQFKNAVRLYTEFLDRMKAMSDADFARQQEELAAELQALVPLSGHITVALAECNPRLIIVAMTQSFLSPQAESLLQEIKQARGK